MTSISAIPDIIRRSIFISEEENTKKNLHPHIDKYQYFLSGLKIKDDYFTVKSVIAIDQNNNRYYDHYIYNHPKELYLTTKKTEVDFQTRYQLTEPVWNENQTSALYYDKRLYEICQEPLFGKSRFHCRFISLAVPSGKYTFTTFLRQFYKYDADGQSQETK